MAEATQTLRSRASLPIGGSPSCSLPLLTHLCSAPYRSSWTPHTLSVTGLVLLTAGGPSSTVRVLTCSLDRSVAIYDLHSNRLLSCKSYPESLTCCAVNPSFDYAYLGSMSGAIYSLAISHAAVALSEANWKLSVAESRSQSAFPATQRSPHSISLLIGHDKPVTSLSHSRDNVTLVSGSQDGHLRIWNTISRQCVLVVDPFSLSPINNAFVSLPSLLLLTLRRSSSSQRSSISQAHRKSIDRLSLPWDT
jgi:pre-rRNA-processing protein IPI3